MMMRVCKETNRPCERNCGAGLCVGATSMKVPDTVERLPIDLQSVYCPFMPQEALIRAKELLGQVRIQRRLIEREPAYVVSGDEEAHDA